jgi:hypothetical protein
MSAQWRWAPPAAPAWTRACGPSGTTTMHCPPPRLVSVVVIHHPSSTARPGLTAAATLPPPPSPLATSSAPPALPLSSLPLPLLRRLAHHATDADTATSEGGAAGRQLR